MTTPGTSAANPWRPYAYDTKNVYVDWKCVGCGVTTHQPGKHGWSFRRKPAADPTRHRHGISNESRCLECGKKDVA